MISKGKSKGNAPSGGKSHYKPEQSSLSENIVFKESFITKDACNHRSGDKQIYSHHNPILLFLLIVILFAAFMQTASAEDSLPLKSAPAHSAPVWIITAGKGVGPVKLGMHFNDVQKAIGKPDRKETTDKGWDYTYYDKGLIILCNESNVVTAIFISPVFPHKKDAPVVKTIDGVKLHDRIEDVIDKWGRPDNITEGGRFKLYCYRGIILRDIGTGGVQSFVIH